ncbi:MFS transporter [Vallitalea guaymasensis]|uniref:MFS transporter n=1 Tax=Vallitalea guaymasensis TaxID=1185412 RepID=UPI000DE3F5E9|nr:MFS transporter [Vallitalea guaymasensis]
MIFNKSKKQGITDYNIKVNIYNGIAFSISINLVKPYFAKFAERLGGNDYHFALLNSLPALLSVFAFLPGALMIESAKSKTKITSKFLLAQKLIYLLIVTVPFLGSVNKPFLFVLLIGLMNFPGSIAIMGYQSSMGDIFIPRNRGRAMSLRNRYSDFSRLIISFISGQALTLIPKTPQQTIILYQIFFFIAFVFGIIEFIMLLRFKNRQDKEEVVKEKYFTLFLETVKDIPKQKKLITFIICSLMFHFGWQMGWPLFSIYSIKILHANESWLSIMTIVNGGCSIIASTRWAKFADKKGNSLALALATMGMAITPLLYVLSKSLLQLVIFNILVGIATAGTILILFNLLLEVTPDKNRTIYIAIYSILINISATIAPLFSVWLKDMTSIYFTLILVAILRLIGSIAFFIRNLKLNKCST